VTHFLIYHDGSLIIDSNVQSKSIYQSCG